MVTINPKASAAEGHARCKSEGKSVVDSGAPVACALRLIATFSLYRNDPFILIKFVQRTRAFCATQNALGLRTLFVCSMSALGRKRK